MSKWKPEDLIEAVKTSNTLKDVIRKLGLKTFGANYKTIRKYVKLLKLDVSHFLSYDKQLIRARSKPRPAKLSNEELFVVGEIHRSVIKTRILQDHLIDHRCAQCGITHWKGAQLSLHLDHINGTNNDNRLENLRFLCPNCHSLTSSYCGKNVRGKPKVDFVTGKETPVKKVHNNKCLECQTPIWHYATHCRSCVIRSTKIDWPSTKKLTKLVRTNGFLQTGKQLGVSDNAIRKHLKTHGVDPKTL